MSEMMEKACRALIDATPGIDGYHESHMAIMRPKVRAVLEAIMEPDEATAFAGGEAIYALDTTTDNEQAKTAWQAMLSAILKEEA